MTGNTTASCVSIAALLELASVPVAAMIVVIALLVWLVVIVGNTVEGSWFPEGTPESCGAVSTDIEECVEIGTASIEVLGA